MATDRLPPPAGSWAIRIEFGDGHLEYFQDEADVPALVAAVMARLPALVAAHGGAQSITPGTERFMFLSPERAAELAEDDIPTINTRGMTWDQIDQILPPARGTV